MADPRYMNNYSRYKHRVFREWAIKRLIKVPMANAMELKFSFDRAYYRAKITPENARKHLEKLFREGKIGKFQRDRNSIYYTIDRPPPNVVQVLEYTRPDIFKMFLFISRKLSIKPQTMPRRYGGKITELWAKIRVMKRLGLVVRRRKEWIAVTDEARAMAKSWRDAEDLEKLLK